MSSKIQIEGNLALDISDESSDDDSEEYIPTHTTYGKQQVIDSDEEEFEAFDQQSKQNITQISEKESNLIQHDAKDSKVEKKEVIPQSVEKNDDEENLNPLAKAMAASVKEVLKKNTETIEIIREASSTHATSSTQSADVFGISYRPYHKPKKEYDMPNVPAFEDEEEFEKDMLNSNVKGGSSSPVYNPNDDNYVDEFDIDDEEAVVNAAAKMIRIENTNLGDNQAESSEDLSSYETSKEVIGNEAAKPSGDRRIEDTSTSMSIQDMAKAAFRDISSVYANGLGDHEISILKANDENAKKDTTFDGYTNGGVFMGVTSVVEEGDEGQEEEGEGKSVSSQSANNNKDKRLIDELTSIWESVNASVPSPDTSPSTGNSASKVGNISYKELEIYFRSLDLSTFLPLIVVDGEEEGSGGGLWSRLTGQSSKKLKNITLPRSELELPFLIAQVNYDPEQFPPHFAALSKIFKFFVSRAGDNCSMFGAHWEKIGFQGTDPRSDLNRSMKMLSVMQMVHFIEHDPSLNHMLYCLSEGSVGTFDINSKDRVEDNSWPLMCVSIGMTKHSIDALRSGNLTAECNNQKSILSVLNDFHHACFYCFAKLLTDNPTIHHAVQLASLRKEVQTEPLGILRAYYKSKESKESKKNKSKKRSGNAQDEDIQYNEIGTDSVADSNTSQSGTKSFWSAGRSDTYGVSK